MRLSHGGVTADLPAGWEGAFSTARPAPGRRTASGERRPDTPSLPVLHLANFALPAVRGDFGSGAVEHLAGHHVFVSLLEYGPECAGTALFARAGVPRRLRPSAFHPRALQRTVAGQAGLQVFFTEAGRAFCLYTVIGDRGAAASLADEASAVLTRITIGPSS